MFNVSSLLKIAPLKGKNASRRLRALFMIVTMIIMIMKIPRQSLEDSDQNFASDERIPRQSLEDSDQNFASDERIPRQSLEDSDQNFAGDERISPTDVSFALF